MSRMGEAEGGEGGEHGDECEMIIHPFISQIIVEALLEFQNGEDLILAVGIKEL